MLNSEETLNQRTQILGRSFLTTVSQFFRNAEIYESNNEIFTALFKSLNNYMNESFRIFHGASIRVSPHSAYLEDQRIYIDAGLVESINFLADLFEKAEIDGLSFLSDCLQPTMLFQAMFTFRHIIVVEGAKGANIIRKSLVERRQPYLELFPITRDQNVLTGLRDESQAEKHALKNALKLMLFLKEMEQALVDQKSYQTNLVFRIMLNLIRINEDYPDYIRALLYLDIPFPGVRANYYCSILLLIVFRKLAVDKQSQLDITVDFLFHNYGRLSLPGKIGAISGQDLAKRGVRKLLETKYVNRSFFYRMTCAYHTPLPQNKSALPVHRFLKVVSEFVSHWKVQTKEPLSPQQCLHGMYKSNTDPLERSFLVTIAEGLGMTPVGSILMLDKEKPVCLCGFEEKGEQWTILLETIPHSEHRISDRLRWQLRDPMEKATYLSRLALISPAISQPNPAPILFKAKVY